MTSENSIGNRLKSKPDLNGNSFSALIIGSGTLPIQCAEILLNLHHILVAVASSDVAVERWAAKKGIPCYPPGKDLAQRVTKPIDYLFSIVNEHILGDDILRLPRKLAVNYHDAPLPRYAGTHATSWALMSGETRHGITWHCISDSVDAGDILTQVPVAIESDDTAFTLNTKCFEAAIKSFAKLVEDLSSGSFVRRNQDLAERTFFPRYKRPPNGCLIDWESKAFNISSMVRALNFGRHPNPLGTPKLCLGGEFLIVHELEILEDSSVLPPGTICGIGRDFVEISTQDKNVRLGNVCSLTGRAVNLAEIADRHGLRVGLPLTSLDQTTLERIDKFYREACKIEGKWVRKLVNQEPAVAPFVSNSCPTGSGQFDTLLFQVPEEFLAVARRFEMDLGPTNIIHTAFGVLLARLGGVSSFDVGFEAFKKDLGLASDRALFATQLPFRFEVDCLRSFSELVGSMRSEFESALNSRFYLTDTYWRFPQLRPLGESDTGIGLPVTLAVGDTFTEFCPTDANQLTLIVSENGTDCWWSYDDSKFSREDIISINRYFLSLLRGIAIDPECPLANLPLLSSDERKQLLIEWNDTAADFPDDRCVHQLFSSCARQFPDNVAIVCGDDEVTYAELDRRSDHLASRLRRIGVRTESLVAVFMERSIDMVVGLLGILKTGAAYVPLDPAQPKQRVGVMIDDCGAAVLLTQHRLRSLLPDNRCEILFPESERESKPGDDADDLDGLVKPDNLAYVIYTSGSTGSPKGVEIEHRGLVNLVTWHQRAYQIVPDDRATLLAGPAFDAAVWELWPYLCAGASIHIPDDDTRASPRKLLTWLADNEITISFAPTPLAEAVLALPIPSNSKLRALLTGGDRLHAMDGRSFPFELINHYGPTESTVVATSDSVETENTETPTIGVPIENTRVFILDQFMQPSPIGIPGEIYIEGVGLARGYRNRPELTAERFVTHRFGDESSIRLYRTGDRGKYTRDGKIAFLDRIDNQVKIRGFRIELGEIEVALLTHPEVNECVVLAIDDPQGTKRLAAYFVAENVGSVNVGVLRNHLRQLLPEYMIPAAFVELDVLAITPNGKVDRRALPVPNFMIVDASREFIGPRNKIESELAEIWKKLLNINPVGVTDNFFELGGDSLISVSLFVEIEDHFGIELPLSALINSPTIEKLAVLLDRNQQQSSRKYLVPLQKEGTKIPLFCVHAAGGNVLFYRDLAIELGKDQPVYGLQARGVADKSETAHDRVEDMARDYLEEIRELQPYGPYRICGSSFGGLVAFELALQLEKLGEKVETLAIFDTYAPGYMDPSNFSGNAAQTGLFVLSVKSLIHQLREINSMSKRASFVFGKVRKLKMRLKRKLIWKKNQFAIEYNKVTGRSLPVNLMRNHKAIRQALESYDPGRYGGDITIFRASEQPKNTKFDPSLGWDEFVEGNVITEVVKGSHGSLTVYPFAADLAAKLEEVEHRKRLGHRNFGASSAA